MLTLYIDQNNKLSLQNTIGLPELNEINIPRVDMDKISEDDRVEVIDSLFTEYNVFEDIEKVVFYNKFTYKFHYMDIYAFGMDYINLDSDYEVIMHESNGNIYNSYNDDFTDYHAVITYDDYMIDQEDAWLFEDEWYDVDDLNTCDCCNEYIKPGTAVEDRNITLCRSCYEEEYHTCDNCGDIIHRDELYYDERSEQELCESCYHDECSGVNNRLEAWDYKPSPIFYGKGDNKLFFGVEIEAKFNDMDSAVDDLEDIHGVYLKEDSSVSDGLEIVTHPMSYDYIKDNVIDTIVEVAVEYSGVSHNYGGMHVHIGRDKFESNQHFSVFYDMINDHVEFTELIAQRSIDRWASINPYKGTKSLKDTYGYNNKGRYCAVNTVNIHTIEIRIFNGNLKKARILKNLEYIAAIFNFSKMFTKPCLNTFLGYVKSERELYPNLYDFIKLKGVI